MESMILAMDDRKAAAVLASMTRPLARRGGLEVEMSVGLGRALEEAFGGGLEAEGSASEGDAARQALLVLAEDPATHGPMASFIEHGTPESFSLGVDAAVIAGVLLVLQTHYKFEKGKDGKFTWKIEKKPTSESLLKLLVGKLLALAPRPPSGGGKPPQGGA